MKLNDIFISAFLLSIIAIIIGIIKPKLTFMKNRKRVFAFYGTILLISIIGGSLTTEPSIVVENEESQTLMSNTNDEKTWEKRTSESSSNDNYDGIATYNSIDLEGIAEYEYLLMVVTDLEDIIETLLVPFNNNLAQLSSSESASFISLVNQDLGMILKELEVKNYKADFESIKDELNKVIHALNQVLAAEPKLDSFQVKELVVKIEYYINYSTIALDSYDDLVDCIQKAKRLAGEGEKLWKKDEIAKANEKLALIDEYLYEADTLIMEYEDAIYEMSKLIESKYIVQGSIYSEFKWVEPSVSMIGHINIIKPTTSAFMYAYYFDESQYSTIVLLEQGVSIENQFDVNTGMNIISHIILNNENIQLAEAVLKTGVDPNIFEGDDPLLVWLYELGKTDYVKLLLNYGANPNTFFDLNKGDTMLLYTDDIDIINLLIDKKANLFVTDHQIGESRRKKEINNENPEIYQLLTEAMIKHIKNNAVLNNLEFYNLVPMDNERLDYLVLSVFDNDSEYVIKHISESAIDYCKSVFGLDIINNREHWNVLRSNIERVIKNGIKFESESRGYAPRFDNIYHNIGVNEAILMPNNGNVIDVYKEPRYSTQIIKTINEFDIINILEPTTSYENEYNGKIFLERFTKIEFDDLTVGYVDSSQLYYYEDFKLIVDFSNGKWVISKIEYGLIN